MAATLLCPLPLFPLFPTLSPHPLFLPLSVWFRYCSICHLEFGVLPSAATSQTRRPLCCFMLSMFPGHPDSSPVSALVLLHQHLRNCWQTALELWEKCAHLGVPCPQVKPPLRLSEGSAGVVLGKGEGLEVPPCELSYFCMFKLLVEEGAIMVP